MRNAASLALILLCGACSQQAPEAGNQIVDNAPVDIEALPADESSITTTEELQNGANEPDATNLGNQH